MTSTRDREQDDGQSVQSATESSRLVAAGRAIGDWLRNSFLYRWLTKEPDPEVIVIDLRETTTVGPFIALLDRATARLAPWWRTSGCRRLCVRTAAGLSARPVRALGVVVMAAAAVRLVAAVASGDAGTGTLAVSLGLFAAGALATRSRHSWQDVQETRGYQILAAALEPPEPPETSGVDEPESDTPDESTTDRNDTPNESATDRNDILGGFILDRDDTPDESDHQN
jgi:hypothetical protein